MPSKSRTCEKCPRKIYADNQTGLCRKCLNKSLESAAPAPDDTVITDRERAKKKADIHDLKKKYADALDTIAAKEREIVALADLNAGVERRDSWKIEAKQPSGTGEATVVVVASDWHCEEEVGPEVNGLNTYTLELAKSRAVQFFQGAQRLTRLLQQDIRIDEMVLALLGDFITGQIHEAENAETNNLTPNLAVVFAQDLLIAGIDFLLDNFKGHITLVCHSGNHARTTKRTRFGAENGHSLEFLLYRMLAAHYRFEPRLKFVIPDGMHSYIDIYDQVIRFQHGHAINYGGGVGGIYIPVNKKIGQWNKGRKANLDVFGHFHQLRDGGNFICNGSMIGYNSFALSIGADYEPPKQALFLMDKKRGRTAMWPILFEDK
jgi:hypothetical protein